MDPLSAQEAKLVEELLYGKQNVIKQSPEIIVKKGQKQSNSCGGTIATATITTYDGEGETITSNPICCSNGEDQNDESTLGTSVITGSNVGVVAAVVTDDCNASIVSGLTTRLEVDGDDIDEIVIPDTTTATATGTGSVCSSSTKGTSNTKKSNKSSTSNIPKVYAKNKGLLDEAEHSRFQKTFKELSETGKKLPKSAVVQKHLEHMALSLMKGTTTATGEIKKYTVMDIVAVLNGIHILCYNILQQPKYTKHSKLVTLCFSILSSLAKGSDVAADQRRAIMGEEHAALIILKCLQSTPPSKELLIHEEGVMALYNIVQHEGNAIEVTPQALSIIMKTMKVHKTRLSIQKACLGILLRLASVDYLYVAKHQEVFDICVSNLTKSCSIKNGQGSLQKVGVMFWRQMTSMAMADEADTSSTHHELQMMIKAGVTDYLLDAMKTFGPNDTSVTQNGFATLTLLSQHCSNAVQTTTLHQLGELLKLVLKHKGDVGVQRESQKWLRSLQNLPQGSFRLPRSMVQDDEVRRVFCLAQIDPNRLLPL